MAALGRLEPQGEVIDISAPPGDRLAELEVDEGQWVEQGQLLGRLESHDERARERDRVATQLQEARVRLGAEVALGEAEITSAELALRELEELYPLEIEEVTAESASLEHALSNDQRELERLGELRTRGAISDADYERQETITRQRQESLRSAQARLRRLEDGQDIRTGQARARISQARAALELARVATQVDTLEQSLALATARVERTLLLAPIAGRILEIHLRPGESTHNAAILSMGNTDVMTVIAEVYETDVQWVAIDQMATISSPALPAPLEGRVIAIGSKVGHNDILDIDPVADVDRRVVEVKIELTDSSRASHLVGLQVDVEIQTVASGS